MDYKHTREIDTFYNLSDNGVYKLPHSLNISPGPNNKAKVRITNDQKTGQVLAKIVKTRLADIDVYSPNDQVDWRVSVNVEIDLEGDVREYVDLDKQPTKQADRNKDRLSYKHQAYQIDLTQVTPSEVSLTCE